MVNIISSKREGACWLQSSEAGGIDRNLLTLLGMATTTTTTKKSGQKMSTIELVTRM
jgi:hypothetical protein